MKGFTKLLAIGTLIAATHAAIAQSAFPQGADGESTGLPAQSTYADAHANDPVRTAASPFPEGADGESTGLAPLGTYADRFDSERQLTGNTEDSTTGE